MLEASSATYVVLCRASDGKRNVLKRKAKEVCFSRSGKKTYKSTYRFRRQFPFLPNNTSRGTDTNEMDRRIRAAGQVAGELCMQRTGYAGPVHGPWIETLMRERERERDFPLDCNYTCLSLNGLYVSSCSTCLPNAGRSRRVALRPSEEVG